MPPRSRGGASVRTMALKRGTSPVHEVGEDAMHPARRISPWADPPTKFGHRAHRGSKRCAPHAHRSHRSFLGANERQAPQLEIWAGILQCQFPIPYSASIFWVVEFNHQPLRARRLIAFSAVGGVPPGAPRAHGDGDDRHHRPSVPARLFSERSQPPGRPSHRVESLQRFLLVARGV